MSVVEVEQRDGGIPFDEIDLGFVPRPNEGVALVEVDHEALLVDARVGTVHALNRVGAVVWQCFDGSDPLSVLVADLAEAFGAPAEVVERDVLALARELGSAGLLQGVAPAHRHDHGASAGYEVGTELPPFALEDADGSLVDLRDLRGRDLLLVNWSPTCGYCVRIAPELAALHGTLEAQGTQLVLLASGDAGRNQALLDEYDARIPMLLRRSAEDGFADPFPGMGTPVAYLVDADGRVAAPVAQGAYQVPELARRAAGVTEAPEGANTRRYLAGASEGMCAAGVVAPKARQWTPTVAYTIGAHHAGIRGESPETDEVLARLLADHRLEPDRAAPATYSVVLPRGEGRSRDLGLLLHGDAVVVRSRSPRRILLGLASYLSSHLEHTDEALLRTRAAALIVDGGAVLLPPLGSQDLEKLQPRFARAGMRLVDVRLALVDPASLELVVPEPQVSIDRSVLDELEEPALGRAELPRVEPGRYPLRAWGVWAGEDGADGSPVEVVSALLSTVVVEPEGLAPAAATLTGLLDRLPIVTLAPDRIERLPQQLTANLRAASS